MGIFSFFRSRPKGTAVTAKERLQVLIAHQHTTSAGPDYLPLLKQDILNVIKKYVDIGEEQVVVQLDSQDDCDVLELNITLPEDATPVESKDADGDETSDAETVVKTVRNKQQQSKQRLSDKATAATNKQKGKKANSRKQQQQKRKKSAATEDSSN